MDSGIIFDGQQTDERVLYIITPHPIVERINLVLFGALMLFFIIIVILISQVFGSFAGLIRTLGIFLSLLIGLVGIWWTHVTQQKSKTYITDRRILRMEPISPFVTAKRALFWNEALKAKAFSTNLVMRMFKVGTVTVEPHLADYENVVITHVYMYEDVANYIDKILFIFKNKPADIAILKPFVPMPRGQRD